MNTQTIVIDIDHTICIPNLSEKNTYERYAKAEPIHEMIGAIRIAKKKGHKIVLFTARRMQTFDGNINKVIEDVAEITFQWLKKHEVPFDELQFGKPNAVYYVDDKSLRPDEFVRIMKEVKNEDSIC
jgi:capsule biosynthesis phosphatase